MISLSVLRVILFAMTDGRLITLWLFRIASKRAARTENLVVSLWCVELSANKLLQGEKLRPLQLCQGFVFIKLPSLRRFFIGDDTGSDTFRCFRLDEWSACNE